MRSTVQNLPRIGAYDHGSAKTEMQIPHRHSRDNPYAPLTAGKRATGFGMTPKERRRDADATKCAAPPGDALKRAPTWAGRNGRGKPLPYEDAALKGAATCGAEGAAVLRPYKI